MVQISSQEVGPLGFGLMGLTWRPQQTPDSIAFPLLRRAIETGCTFWNSGEFYGTPDPTLNLQLLNRYFKQYPDDRAKVFISVKGCLTPKMASDCSPAGVRKSVEHSVSVMGGYIDLFQPARVDQSTPIEDTMAEFKKLIEEGKIKHVGLSECGQETIRRASKVGTVAAVEQEYSLWSTEIESNGVIDACRDCGIPLIAYSPLGRGFLTGQITSRDDLPEGDMRLHVPRFYEENFDKNLDLVKRLQAIAKEKAVPASQLAISWVLAQQARLGVKILPIPGSTSIGRFDENLGGTRISISEKEMEEIQKALDSVEIAGGRYHESHQPMLFGETPEKK